MQKHQADIVHFTRSEKKPVQSQPSGLGRAPISTNPKVEGSIPLADLKFLPI